MFTFAFYCTNVPIQDTASLAVADNGIMANCTSMVHSAVEDEVALGMGITQPPRRVHESQRNSKGYSPRRQLHNHFH